MTPSEYLLNLRATDDRKPQIDGFIYRLQVARGVSRLLPGRIQLMGEGDGSENRAQINNLGDQTATCENVNLVIFG